MKKIIDNIIKKISNFDLNPREITSLIEKIKDLQKQNSPIVKIICDDDFQVLKLARLLIHKLDQLNDSEKYIRITGEDWRQENVDFSLIMLWVDDLELNRVINYKVYGMGGHAHFQIIKKRDLLRYVYDEVEAVISNLRFENESKLKPYKNLEVDFKDKIQERREIQINALLNNFKQFVERDGWKAFWKDGTIKHNNLKNQSEEIGKSQLMAFLKGHGLNFEIKHNTFQEVKEGAGFCDVIHIDDIGAKFIFELKIWRGKSYFDTGIKELDHYLSHEGLDKGYYIIFDKRIKDKKEIPKKIEIDNKKQIDIIQIDIAQIPPTKSS